MTWKRSLIALVMIGAAAFYGWLTYWQMSNGNYGWFALDVVITLVYLVFFIVAIKPLWRK